MPKRDSAPDGAPCWIDLATSDPDESRSFYGRMFSWAAEEAGEEYGGYINFSKGDDLVAGCMRNPQPGSPDAWSVYLATQDAKATADAAAAHGGQVHLAAMKVMDLGSMAVLGDPGGAGIGVWQPGTHRGFGVLAEAGAPCWFELHTRDYDTSVDFYRTVFGWPTQVASDTPEFRYTTLGEGDNQLAGVMDVSNFPAEDFPVGWSVYFGVEDTDAALARVVELGGSILQGAKDSPFGRLAQCADPTGASFKLVSVS